MSRTPGEHAMWLVCIGRVVRVLGSIFKLAIMLFWSIWGAQLSSPLKYAFWEATQQKYTKPKDDLRMRSDGCLCLSELVRGSD